MTTGSPRPPDAAAGRRMHDLISELYGIPRSITGDGVRETLRRIGERLPVEIHELESGTRVYDWQVPPEWNVSEAWIDDATGRRIVDFADSSLHLLGYSEPVRARMGLDELREHLHTLPEHPEWIPYRTSYYARRWGFCLPHRVYESLEPGEYEVCIDATLEPGRLTWGECVLPGRTEEEFLVSAHVCHPALCNDNLSGIAVAVELARRLREVDRRYTYRFLFAPGTIGAITWLARNEEVLPRIRHGLVLTCVGDRGAITYKRSCRTDAEIDRAVEYVLRRAGQPHGVRDFTPCGYDERQYGSQGIDLPVGCLMRTPHGEYPEYHTSADDLAFVDPGSLADSLARCLEAIGVVEGNLVCRNRKPRCEPQLGRRGLFSTVGGRASAAEREWALLWVLHQSDGERDLLAIAERSGIAFDVIRAAASDLLGTDLLDVR